jgi:trans-2,3-dihydro-3-hydroxyanthranilate isomerase
VRYRFLTADVFTDHPYGGNPLAVLPAAAGLSTGQMRAIARELNLSETAFVLPPEDPGHFRRVRIFTPAKELPFAGHPTVGTALVLAHLGEIGDGGAAAGAGTAGGEDGREARVVFEEGVGPVPVTVRFRGGVPVFAQLAAAQLPVSGPPPPDRAALADLLSLDPADLPTDGEPETVSCGVPFLFIPVRDRAALARARVRIDRFDALFPQPDPPELFPFCGDPELPGSHLRARMFAPALGIAEDPATGGAVAALGGYLGWRDPRRDGTLAWTVEQGFEMGRPSLLHLEVDKQDGAITAVRVGGTAVLISEGTIEAPPS